MNNNNYIPTENKPKDRKYYFKLWSLRIQISIGTALILYLIYDKVSYGEFTFAAIFLIFMTCFSLKDAVPK